MSIRCSVGYPTKAAVCCYIKLNCAQRTLRAVFALEQHHTVRVYVQDLNREVFCVRGLDRLEAAKLLEVLASLAETACSGFDGQIYTPDAKEALSESYAACRAANDRGEQ